MILKQLKAYRLWFLLGGLVLMYLLYVSNSPKLQLSKKTPPTVVVAHPTMVTMAEYIHQTGNTSAYHSIDLVARVEGNLEKNYFTAGTFVDKGSSLFLIEPKPYLEKLEQAKASVQAAKASLKYAKSEYNRQIQMFKQNATSQNNVEMWVAKVQQAEAELLQAKSDVTQAALNYSYTTIIAPFNGRIGRAYVDVGNLVGNGSATKLATIEQLVPMYVYFNLNELDLLKLRKIAKENGATPKTLSTIKVGLGLQNEKGYPHEGRLNFVNSSVDASTGTIQFRAIFDNNNLALVPGLFVKVRIAISPNVPRISIPKSVLMYDQVGPYVYKVDKNNQAKRQRLTLGPILGGWQSIVSGIEINDNIIIEGMQFVIDGKQVNLTHAKESSLK